MSSGPRTGVRPPARALQCVAGIVATVPTSRLFHVSLSTVLCNERLKLLIGLPQNEAAADLQGGNRCKHYLPGNFALAIRARCPGPIEAPFMLALLAKSRFAPSIAAVIGAPANSWTIDWAADLSNVES